MPLTVHHHPTSHLISPGTFVVLVVVNPISESNSQSNCRRESYFVSHKHCGDMGNDSEISHIEDSSSQPDLEATDYAPAEIQKEIGVLDDPDWVAAQKKYLRRLDFIILPTISTLYFRRK